MTKIATTPAAAPTIKSTPALEKAQNIIREVRQVILTEEFNKEIPASYEQADGGCNHGGVLSFAWYAKGGRLLIQVDGIGTFRAVLDEERIEADKAARNAAYVAEREALYASIEAALLKQCRLDYKVVGTQGHNLGREILRTHEGGSAAFSAGDAVYQLFIPRKGQPENTRSYLASNRGYSYIVEQR